MIIRTQWKLKQQGGWYSSPVCILFTPLTLEFWTYDVHPCNMHKQCYNSIRFTNYNCMCDIHWINQKVSLNLMGHTISAGNIHPRLLINDLDKWQDSTLKLGHSSPYHVLSNSLFTIPPHHSTPYMIILDSITTLTNLPNHEQYS
jgi:hypothetical protein